jgi:hypothetical protein
LQELVRGDQPPFDVRQLEIGQAIADLQAGRGEAAGGEVAHQGLVSLSNFRGALARPPPLFVELIAQCHE